MEGKTKGDVTKCRAEVENLVHQMEGWCDELTEYQRIGESLFKKMEGVLESIETAAKSKNDTFNQTGKEQSEANSSLLKIVSVLRKIERMKWGLVRKTDVMVVSPIQENIETKVQPTLEKGKEVRRLEKELEKTTSQMNKGKNPFKVQQHKAKFEDLKKKLEIESFDYASQLQEVVEKNLFNFVNWMMGVMFANLSFFRQGFKILEDLETDMKKTTETILKEETKKEDEMEKSRQEMMKKIEEKKKTNTEESSEKQGFLKWSGRTYWVAISNGVLSYYKGPGDDIPKGSVDLLLCTAKDYPERPTFFDIISPVVSMNFEAPSPEEAARWLGVIRMSIYNQLETHKKIQREAKMSTEVPLSQRNQIPPLTQLNLEDESNKLCVDCNAPNPDWASINFGVLVCYECSGVHRSLGTHISKIRSLTLDKWEPQMLQVIKYLGNARVNQILEATPAHASMKPGPNSTREEREKYITAKYRDKQFVSRSPPEELNGLSIFDVALRVTNNSEMLMQMLHLIVRRESIHAQNPAHHGTTVLHFLAASNNVVGVEFALQNDCSVAVLDDNGWTPLHHASFHDNIGPARLLINRGAMVDQKDHEGNTPHALAKENECQATCQFLASFEMKGRQGDDV